jgi:glycerophosphoryl diester phosphodiesterase
MNRATLILGHRGSPRSAIENTLASFARARAEGADGVELDVHRASDGTPVIIHDDELHRTMGTSGQVSRLGWPAIEHLTGARVPSLQQAMAWAAASESWVNIEIKAAGLEKAVAAAVDETSMDARVFISSFDAEVVRRVGEAAPSLTRYLLTEEWDPRAEARLASSGASGICLHVESAADEAIREMHDRDLEVVVWTVNDPGTVERLLRLEVRAIITDLPAMAARVRDRLLSP